ncbi:hypothetical protein BAUCODRAFT_32265 [Baudoinia panamericana UAMH 10762]|uniref:Uncharacterized protein n=1 Tax=Baudoinia panamericana (strain UAMH 10762) TaxID=717646 RepID=M2NG31_BAUPA|nr:uncharacterized protein BAUCODRAFT_32265 [Baudoinia panamericana UAMH 10762]EMC98249.1 hypothetical protein BAUCODRAFT_32265 [Baudoinia panamericana UAMH 10762]
MSGLTSLRCALKRFYSAQAVQEVYTLTGTGVCSLCWELVGRYQTGTALAPEPERALSRWNPLPRRHNADLHKSRTMTTRWWLQLSLPGA